MLRCRLPSVCAQAAFDRQLEAAAAAAPPPSPKKALHTDPRFIEQEVCTAVSVASFPSAVCMFGLAQLLSSYLELRLSGCSC